MMRGEGTVSGYAAHLEHEVEHLRNEMKAMSNSRNTALNELDNYKQSSIEGVTSAHLMKLERHINSISGLVQAAARGQGEKGRDTLEYILQDIHKDGQAGAMNSLLHVTRDLGMTILSCFQTFQDQIGVEAKRKNDRIEELEQHLEIQKRTQAGSAKGAEDALGHVSEVEDKLAALQKGLDAKMREIEAEKRSTKKAVQAIKEQAAETDKAKKVIKQEQKRIEKLEADAKSARQDKLSDKEKAAAVLNKLKSKYADKEQETAEATEALMQTKQELINLGQELKSLQETPTRQVASDSLQPSSSLHDEVLRLQGEVASYEQLREQWEQTEKKFEKEKKKLATELKRRDDELEAAKSSLWEKEQESKQHLEIQERSVTTLEHLDMEIQRRWRPSAPEIEAASIDDDVTLMAEVDTAWPPAHRKPSWSPFLVLKPQDTILVTNSTGEGAPAPDDGMVMWFGSVSDGGEPVGEPGWFPARYVQVDDAEEKAVKLTVAKQALQ